VLQKAFYNILLELNLNVKKAKRGMEDKRLTLTEKKIIEGHLHIRNNQNPEALALMRGLPQSEAPFIEGQRRLLMGLALNNLSHFNEAEISIKHALDLFSNLNVPYFEFVGHLYLFTIYSNRSQIDKMSETLQTLKSIRTESEHQPLKLLRCQFDYYALVDEEKALEVLKKIELKKMAMTEGDIISHLVCEFMFFVKCEDFERCEKTLNEMKKYRKFNLTENFNFMKKLLDHLNKNAPIYMYGDDFKSVPVLYLQLKVIHSFEEKNISNAQGFWNELQALYPEIYLSDFNYTGAKCLFSLCLDKHQVQQKPISPIQKVDDASLLDTLVDILVSTNSPVPKAQLYECLWKEIPEAKEDMQKLTRLISRARSERGIEIKSRKGTYFTDQVPTKIKAG